MTTDFSHGWEPPKTVQEFQGQIDDNIESLFNYMIGHLSRYRTERDNIRSQLEEANKLIDKGEEQINQLSLDLNISRAGHQPVTTSNNENISRVRSERFPDPEKFDGTRSKLPGFIIQMQMKLEINSDRFRNESAKVIYSISRLEGRALDQVVPLVSANPSAPFPSVTTFLQYLQSSFGDPNPKGTARRELMALKQGNGDFASYYSQFLRIMAHLDYNESAKIDALKDGLSDELKLCLTHYTDLPESTEAYGIKLMIIDNQIRGLKADQALRNNRSQFYQPNITPHPSHIPGGLAPMDLSAAQLTPCLRPKVEKRYAFVNGQRKISQAEKNWRRENHLCMYCAGSGHVTSNCPSINRIKENQSQINAGTLLANSNPLLSPITNQINVDSSFQKSQT